MIKCFWVKLIVLGFFLPLGHFSFPMCIHPSSPALRESPLELKRDFYNDPESQGQEMHSSNLEM